MSSRIRQRLPSASYNAPAGDSSIWSRETLVELPVAVVSGNRRDPIAMARHVAEHISSPTPFFVMDVAGVQHRLNSLADHLPRVVPTFDVACNADPILARILANSDDIVFEATNGMEIEAALKHVDPVRCLVRSNTITRKTIKTVGETSCGGIVIESLKHLDDAIRYAPQAELYLAVALPYSTCEIQIGCLVEDAEEIIVMAHCMGSPLIGISIDLGPTAQPHQFVQAMRETRRLMDFAEKRGLEINRLHIGAIQFPAEDEDGVEFRKTCSTLTRIVEAAIPDYVVIQANFGLFIASDAFTLCTNVVAKQQLAVKDITNDEFDDGIGFVYQTNDGFYGTFGCKQMDVNPLCQPLHTSEDGELHVGTVVGATLDPMDLVQTVVKCRQLQVGEWLVWQQMGAFTIPLDDEDSGDKHSEKPPVYYYTRRDSWDQLMTREEQRRSPSPFTSVTSSYSESSDSDSDLYLDAIIDFF